MGCRCSSHKQLFGWFRYPHLLRTRWWNTSAGVRLRPWNLCLQQGKRKPGMGNRENTTWEWEANGCCRCCYRWSWSSVCVRQSKWVYPDVLCVRWSVSGMLDQKRGTRFGVPVALKMVWEQVLSYCGTNCWIRVVNLYHLCSVLDVWSIVNCSSMLTVLFWLFWDFVFGRKHSTLFLMQICDSIYVLSKVPSAIGFLRMHKLNNIVIQIHQTCLFLATLSWTRN